IDWTWEHRGSSAVATASPDGAVWVALRGGELLRLDPPYQRPVLKVPTVAGASAIAAIGRAVVVGSTEGILAAHRMDGFELGRDDRGVRLTHLATGSEGSLLAATARGPSVLRLGPDIFPANTVRLTVESGRTLARWLAEGVTPDEVAAIDLIDWPKVVA